MAPRWHRGACPDSGGGAGFYPPSRPLNVHPHHEQAGQVTAAPVEDDVCNGQPNIMWNKELGRTREQGSTPGFATVGRAPGLPPSWILCRGLTRTTRAGGRGFPDPKPAAPLDLLPLLQPAPTVAYPGNRRGIRPLPHDTSLHQTKMDIGMTRKWEYMDPVRNLMGVFRVTRRHKFTRENT
jgi:hypothetical protein